MCVAGREPGTQQQDDSMTRTAYMNAAATAITESTGISITAQQAEWSSATSGISPSERRPTLRSSRTS